MTFTECPHRTPAHPQPEADLGWATNVWATEKEKEEKKRKRTRRGGVEKKKRKEKEEERHIEEMRVRKVLSLATGATN